MYLTITFKTSDQGEALRLASLLHRATMVPGDEDNNKRLKIALDGTPIIATDTKLVGR